MIKRLINAVDIRDVLGIVGFAALVYGVARFSVDAAFIVAGILMLGFTIVAARK